MYSYINKNMLTRVKVLAVTLLTVLTLLLTSCSSLKEDEPRGDVKEEVEELYNQAMDAIESNKYQAAINRFEEIERTYPYSKLAIKAQVMRAFAQYKWEKYDEALAALEQFIKLHPGNKDIPYAYYLKALCYYERINDVRRDQEITEKAKTALKEVVARFPNSEYAKDSSIKLDLVNDHLAGKELDVGRFYLNQDRYIAALNRFKKVVDVYDTTTHIKEALYRMVEVYVAIGIRGEAVKYAAVLGHNYPGSKWYERAYDLLSHRLPQADLSELAKPE